MALPLESVTVLRLHTLNYWNGWPVMTNTPPDYWCFEEGPRPAVASRTPAPLAFLRRRARERWLAEQRARYAIPRR